MPQDANRPITPPSGKLLKGRHILVAVIAHALLFLALSLNMQWRSETPPPSMAELWTELPTPQNQNHQQPPEQPRQNPQPLSEPTTVTPPNTALADTDIALAELRRQEEAQEAEKRRLAEEALQQQQLEAERKAREEAERQHRERERLAAEEKARQEEAGRQRRAEEERKARETAERQRQEQERLAAEEKARQQEAERQEQERLAAEEKTRQEEAERQRVAEEERRRQEEEKRKREEEERQRRAREAAERDRIMQEQLNRIQGMAGGEGNSNTGTTDSPGGSGNAHAAYTSRLAGIVRRNIAYTGDRSSNPSVQVYVDTDNNGRIKTVRLTRSSGNPTWDDAAIRGIWKTETFPPDTNGKRPSTTFNFTLKPE